MFDLLLARTPFPISERNQGHRFPYQSVVNTSLQDDRVWIHQISFSFYFHQCPILPFPTSPQHYHFYQSVHWLQQSYACFTAVKTRKEACAIWGQKKHTYHSAKWQQHATAWTTSGQLWNERRKKTNAKAPWLNFSPTYEKQGFESMYPYILDVSSQQGK